MGERGCPPMEEIAIRSLLGVERSRNEDYEILRADKMTTNHYWQMKTAETGICHVEGDTKLLGGFQIFSTPRLINVRYSQRSISKQVKEQKVPERAELGVCQAVGKKRVTVFLQVSF